MGQKMVKTEGMDISCAIIAGGRNRRMGRDKATLMLGDRPMINRVYETVRGVFEDIIIVSSYHREFAGIDAPVLPDVMPMRGSMVGIASALMHVSSRYVFVVACDMPNLSEKALRYMMARARGEDVIIPRTRYGYEALHAIYNRSCLSEFITAITKGKFKITDVFPYLVVKELGEHPVFLQRGRAVFTNVNTEEDLLAATRFDKGRDVEIRTMTENDLPQVLVIEKGSFTSPWTKRLFEEALFSPIAENFVITTETEVTGYLCFYTVEDEAHILNIAVHPGKRNMGYASALMAGVIEGLKEKGITQFYLEVREGNKEALRLYDKFGFKAIGKRKKYYTDTNEDALVMLLAVRDE